MLLRISFGFAMFTIRTTMFARAFQVKNRIHPALFRGIPTGCRLLLAETTRNVFSSRKFNSLKSLTSDENETINSGADDLEPMVNLYQEWTVEQDQTLWENRNQPKGALASLLGRGLRGVETRLAKLKDPNSQAYGRLFSDGAVSEAEEVTTKTKLVPASEVLRRIQWDATLSSADFSILHYDRVDDTVVESPYDAPNTSIAGKATSLIDALPEHRIVGIKYKERVVWDRKKRMDVVFSDPGIAQVIEGYDEWKRRKDAVEEFNRQRQAQVALRLQQILGLERFSLLKDLSNELQTKSEQSDVTLMSEVEFYIQDALVLFRQVRDDPSSSLDPTLIPLSECEAMDQLSEIVALLPDTNLRTTILTQLSRSMRKALGKKENKVSIEKKALPEIQDDELTETFVRGTGPGGQKINKTSNRVVLVHNPTQVRVECQDTRSLQQNRKIARKRLRIKLDEYLNGSSSRSSVKAQKASSKKAKAKARSRARQRQKRDARLQEEE